MKKFEFYLLMGLRVQIGKASFMSDGYLCYLIVIEYKNGLSFEMKTKATKIR